MPVSYKKNRAMSRILRNKFHAAPAPKPQAEPEPAASAVHSLSAEIPKSYNDTYVRAIPQDPQNTFVYWEMPEKSAENIGMEANGKTHTENGEAAAIQNKVNGESVKPRHVGGDNNNHTDNDNRQDNNHPDDGNNRQGNDNHGRNHGQYYDFESNSWRIGGHRQEGRPVFDNGWNRQPHGHENFQDNHQTYRDDSTDFGMGQRQQHNEQHHHTDHDSHQTYRHDDNSRRRNGRHYRHSHDSQRHYQYQQQYYSHPEHCYMLTEFMPSGSIGRVYMETPGIAAGTAVLTAWRSIVLDICKSHVRQDTAVPPYLSSGVLQKKTVAAPPPHLSSGILCSNSGAAGQP